MALTKLTTLASALERSSFFPRHVFLRSSLLLVYDNAETEKDARGFELKMINFDHCYALPTDASPLTHVDPWDGDAASHEDGYLAGVHSLVRLMKAVVEQLKQ